MLKAKRNAIYWAQETFDELRQKKIRTSYNKETQQKHPLQETIRRILKKVVSMDFTYCLSQKGNIDF